MCTGEMKTFSIVVAATTSVFGIGIKGGLPWKIAEDMAFFKKITTSAPENKMNAVIMGRKTYESIPAKSRPLPDRVNVVLSRDPNLTLPDSVLVASTFEDALAKISGAEYADAIHEVFVIGGGAVYKEALDSMYCNKIYLTEVRTEIQGLDTFFPPIPTHVFQRICQSELQQGKEHAFWFTEYHRIDTDSLPVPLPSPEQRI